MSAEFTGERVIPGQVDIDLWNEHVARYTFASRLCRGGRVLDMGCGVGYGTAELACEASSVTGMDSAAEALTYAKQRYSEANTQWVSGSASDLPFRDAVFDHVVCFEVIEHLEKWRELLRESRRVLSDRGRFVVSTPNRTFYAHTRAESGPNAFHVHEFDHEEFHAALREVFPHVSMFVQDHSECVLFRFLGDSTAGNLRLVGTDARPEHSNFFFAVCSLVPQTGLASFAYLPAAANLLRERTLHIERLKAELALKERWITEAQSERDQLALMLKGKDAELEERTGWLARLDAELATTSARVIELQRELEQEQEAAKRVVAAYESKVVELEGELRSRTAWVTQTEERYSQELSKREAELAACHDLLQQAENTVEERTLWAQSLDRERETLSATVSAVQASRWMKLGRMLGLGPENAK